MNLDYTAGTRSYVDIAPTTPVFAPYPSRPTSFWPTPQPDARLGHTFPTRTLRSTSASSRYSGPISAGVSPAEGVTSRELFSHPSAHQQPNPQLPPHLQQYYTSQPANLPPVQPSQQLSSTPNNQETERHHLPSSHPAQGLFTPPSSATLSGHRPTAFQGHIMNDQRNMSGGQGQRQGQRQMMGPPETPSRVMQASPTLFPSLQFSPDPYSTQGMVPMTAPMYPQQRLFWDPSASHPQQHIQPQYQNPFQEFDNSFNSTATIVPSFAPLPSQDQPYELPSQPPPMGGNYLDTSAFPAPFQTSPRAPPQLEENPTLFLSSPARRFGGSEVPVRTFTRRPVHEVPAYHHQIQESRREMEVEQERRRSRVSKRAGDELIMQSVKRALSPSKTLRPSMTRSFTHSGVAAQELRRRRSSRGLFNDSASATSTTSINSAKSSRTGRLSPLKQSSFAGLSVSKPFQQPRKSVSVSLAIDENGVAKTVLEEVPESEDDMDLDEESPSVASSTEEIDYGMVRSQQTSFSMENDDLVSGLQNRPSQHSAPFRPQDRLNSASRTSRRSVSSFSSAELDHNKSQQDTIRASRRAPLHIDTQDTERRRAPGDAQRALRAIIQDRSRSASTQGDHSSSRQSDSSTQFHSSPPMQHNPFGPFGASPTTTTDPDLATPNTDQDSLASLGALRCICNSTSPDSSPMIQCDSCSKWLHSRCIGLDGRRMPTVYVCVYCEQTPVRHTATRRTNRPSLSGSGQSASPLAHKSARSQRTRQ